MPSLDAVAERYVKLVLGVGQHDPDYVDAYYGPDGWRPQPHARPMPLQALRDEAARLIAAIPSDAPRASSAAPASADAVSVEQPVDDLRREYLRRQLQAVDARIRMLAGERLTFDEESRALYDAVAPVHEEDHFSRTLAALDARLPGAGPVPARHEAFKREFIIPPNRVDAVFQAAIQACRSRTHHHLVLPRDERFTVEYVTGKSWSGYNWYKGGATSVIQVNTDLPIYVDRAVDLAAHEGYPGHHVYNALLETHLVRERGWVEFSVYALFSPQSLIAEGTANFGIEVAFPGEERVAFERECVFPLAGLDPDRAEDYYAVAILTDRLAYAGNEAARRYLNGEISCEEAVVWLETYALMPRARAEQRVRFFDQFRSYVINYNVGKDLVREYIEHRGGTPDAPERRWFEFAALLSSPRLPSGLRRATPTC
jgi:hypothetical protein